MSFSLRPRVEDVLFILLSVAVAIFAGVGAMLRGLAVNEDRVWDLSFILLPVAIIVFVLSLQYAFAGTESAAVRRLRAIGSVVRDWLPFLFFMLAYETFQSSLFTQVSPRLRDAELLRIDRAMFGETPAVLMQHWARPWLTNLLSLAYFMHLVLPPLLAVIWYRRNLRTFRAFLLAVFVSAVFASIGYNAVPAVGPETAFPQLFTIDLFGNFYSSMRGITDPLRAMRDVFPSLHVAISSIVLYFAWRRRGFWFWMILPWVLLNWVSTLYLRYHYFIDVIAGWIVAALCIAGAYALLSLEERILGSRSTPPETVEQS